MTTDNPLQALQSLAQRKTNATISIAADLANDNLNSICRFALSWISNGKGTFVLNQAAYRRVYISQGHTGHGCRPTVICRYLGQ